MFNGPVFNNETIQANARAVNGGGISENLDEANALYSRLTGASFKLVPSSFGRGVLYSGAPGANGDLTWTRGSDAFRTNASELIQRVPWNLLQYSEDFSNAAWTKTASSVTANTTTSPDGTSNADTYSQNSSGFPRLSSASFTFNANTDYTLSVYLKNIDAVRFSIVMLSDLSTTSWFNLETNTLESSTGSMSGATITSVGNDWYRVTANIRYSTTTSTAFYYRLSTSSSVNSVDFSKSVYIWGAQLVEGTTAQTYLPTTDRLNFPRLSYMYGSCPALLLEPQRTNVVLWSSDLSQSVWSKTNYTLSSATAIQGLTATRITKNATSNGTWNGSGARNVINSVGTFASGTKAFSVLLRKGNTAKVGLLINGILVGALTNVSCEFDFATETFTNVATGLTATFEKPTTDVYRLILVCNDIGIGTSKQLWIAPIDSSNNTVTDGYVDVAYFQWELGAYPTTIIPTTSAQATRIADTFSRSNIYTNGLISASGGTWFVELRNNVAMTRDTSEVGLFIGNSSNGTSGDVLAIRNNGTGRLSITKRISGTQTGLIETTTTTTKIAIKWNGTSADVFVNGTKQVSATAFATTNMEFFNGSGADVPKFIQQMALYPTPLSDADCASLTADYTDGTSIVGDYERYVSQKSGAVENLSGVTNLIQNLK